MGNKFVYERISGELVVCEKKGNGWTVSPALATLPNSADKNEIEKSTDEKKYYTYSDVDFDKYRNKAYVILGDPKKNKSGKKTDLKPIHVPQDVFCEKIDAGHEKNGQCHCKVLTVQSVPEYISILDLVRTVALFQHVIMVLRSKSMFELEKGLLEDLRGLISGYSNINKESSKNREIINATIQSLEKKIGKSIEALKDAGHEIKRAISLYKSGGSFCYYRGVGRTVYPEKPGIYREERIREEDRWYREMKTLFQEELEKKTYLDRLAMLQHYELPTRMLDVTSNPLVALYMAVNTLYTGDAEQTGIGEIIVYYEGLKDEKPMYYSCDNYANDIVFAYDGKSYDSGVILVIAALVKVKYENKERIRRVLTTFKKLIDMYVDTIRDNGEKKDIRYKLIELVNRCIHTNADHYEKQYFFSADEISSYAEAYPRIIPDNYLFERPDQVCSLLWELADVEKNGIEGEYVYQDKNEFENNYLMFISSYRYILSTVRRESPAYRDHINVFDLLRSFHVKMGRTNDRIKAQAGSFIICGLDPDYIGKEMVSSRSEGFFRVFVKNKKEIARQLKAMDIYDSTMIPDMAHHEEYLKECAKRTLEKE